jgi:hypothetical protein
VQCGAGGAFKIATKASRICGSTLTTPSPFSPMASGLLRRSERITKMCCLRNADRASVT